MGRTLYNTASGCVSPLLGFSILCQSGYLFQMDGNIDQLSAIGSSLLGAEDGPAVTVVNPDGLSRTVLCCDHASNRIPVSLGNLGLEQSVIEDHVGWDIGAEAIARHLSAELNAAAVICGYSRLVIDCNRPPGSPASIPEISDAIAIPGNEGLSPAEKRLREKEILEPYHQAIRDQITGRWQQASPPALVSIHTFTPALRETGVGRPWQICILWGHDGRIAQPLMDNLAQVDGLIVGDNVPYSGRNVAYTVNSHGFSNDLPHVGIEIRQDLVSTPEGAKKWAMILLDSLGPVLADPGLYQQRHF